MRRFLSLRNLWNFFKDLVFIPGVIFIAVTTFTSFFDNHQWVKSLNESLKSNLILILLSLVSLIYAVFKNLPKNRFEYKLNNKDTRLKMVIGDYFKQKGAFVVPVNDEFDICLGGTTLKSNSIKAQVISKFFGGKCEDLSWRVKKQLSKDVYKSQKSGKKYKMGTTVFVEENNQKFYFVVNSIRNENKRVEARKDDLENVLAELWTFLSNHASKGEVVLPLLGTGNGRISLERGGGV